MPIEAVRLAGVVRRSRRGLLLGTALQATVVLVLALPASVQRARAQPAPNARPQGGVVVAGSAVISRTPTATSIDQSSQRAALNWRSFDVGSQQSVDFHQPDANAVVLNRVVGPNPSQIAGKITANGQVILQNQDGITFYKGAQVNAAGFVATAAGITKKNFMAGRMVFDQAAHPNAAVVNEGRITVRQAGIAALVAPQVANSGVIEAKLGRVVLAGAKAATLDLYGDGLVSIDVSGEVTKVPVGPDGKPVTALVTNTGTILAAGGHVLLTARQAAGIVQNLVVAGGTVSAPTRGGETGQIVLNGIGGSLVVAGALLAQGKAAGTTGGQIELAPSGGVSLASTARVDASGSAGGGTIAIGTDLARAAGGARVAPTLLSQNVTVARGAAIAANATRKGNGGRVTVLSADSTVMGGTIAAQGGPAGGDGGSVELSGRTLGFDGNVNVGAPAGVLGSIQFDPATLDIVTGSGKQDGNLGSGTILAGGSDTTPDTIGSKALGALAGNITLQATSSIDVQASVSVSSGLTLQSGGDLTLENGVSLQAGGTLWLGAGVVFPAGTVGATGALDVGTSLGAGVTLNAPAAVLEAGSLIAVSTPLSMPGSGQTLNLNSGRDLTIASGASIVSAGNIFVSASGGTLTQDGAITAAGEASLGAGSGGISVGASISASKIELVSGSTIDANADVVPTTQAYVQAAGAQGVTIEAGHTLGAAGALVGLRADTIRDLGTVIAGTLEVAPNSTAGAASVITLGGAPSSLGLDTLLASGESLLRLGAVTPFGGGTPIITASSIAVAGGFGSGSINLELDAAGPVTEGGSGALTAATLTGSVTGGAVTLNQSANAIGALGSFAVSGNGFTLASTGSLAVTGPVSGTNVTITAGTLAVGGSITAGAGTGNTLALTTNAGTLGLDNGAVLSATTIALDGGTSAVNIGSIAVVNAGSLLALGGAGVTAVAGGTLIAGTLTGIAPLTGPVDLAAGHNVIGTIDAFTVKGGDFTLIEAPGTALTIGGSVSVGNGRLALGADSLTIGGAGSLVAGTIALAPVTSGSTVTLGSAGSGLVLPAADFTQMNAGRIDIGSLNGGGSITAGAISITAAISAAPTTTLGLFSNNTIVEPAGSLIVGGLVGYAGSGADLAAGNSIATIGSFGVGSGQALTLNDVATNVTLSGASGLGHFIFTDPNGTVTVAGSISGGNVTIDPAVIDVTSTISVTAGGTIALDAGDAISTPGTILLGSGSTLLAAGGAVELSALQGGAAGGGVTQAQGGIIVAGTLFSAGGVSGGVDLPGSNTVAAIGSFPVTSGDFTLADGGATSLALNTGAILTAGNVSLGVGGAPGTISIDNGTVASGAQGTVTLNGGSGGITLLGTGYLGGGGLNTLDLTTAGGINEAATAKMLGTLQSSGGIIGAVDLAGTANALPQINGFVVTGGNLSVVEQANQPLTLTGSVSAAGHAITIATDAFTLSAGGSLVGASVALAPVTPGTSLSVGSSYDAITAGTIAIGSLDGGATIDAGTIDIASALSFAAGTTLALYSSGTIAEMGGGIAVASLVGSAGTGAGLGQSNTIATLGSFAAGSGTLVLADSGTLTVAGPVSGAGVTIDPASIDVAGAMSVTAGGTIALDAGIAGTTPGTIALGAHSTLLAPNGAVELSVFPGGGAGAGVTQAAGGSISAATLFSANGVSGGVDLPGANTIASIGSLAVAGGGFVLSDGAASLSVTGRLAADNVTIGGGTLSSPGTIAVSGSIGAGTLVSLASGSGGIALDSGALVTGPTLIVNGGAGGVALNGTAILGDANTTMVGLGATSGGVTEASTAAINAGTLLSVGSVGGTVWLGQGGTGNTIAAIGSFAAGGGDFTLSDSAQTLSVTGSLTAGNVTIDQANSLVVSGSIGAQTLVALTSGGGGIALAGSAVVSGGTLSLTDSGGGVTEASAAVISVGTLTTGTGSVSGAADLAGTLNAIGTIGRFATSNGDFILSDAIASLSAAGPLTANNVTIGGGTLTSPGTIGVAGSIGAGTLVSLASGAGGIALDSGAIVTGATLILNGAGGVTLNGSATLGNATSLVELGAASGGVTEAATGTINAGTLLGVGSISGSADLAGIDNAIGTLGGFVVSGNGNLTLIEKPAQALTVAGSVSATGQTIALGADGLALAPTGSLVAARVEIAPVSAAGTLVTLGAAASGLSLVAADFTRIAASEIDIGRLTSGATIAGAIDIDAGIAVPGSTLGLYAAGPIGESGAGSLTAGALIGQAGGSVTLLGANAIGTLDGFTTNGTGNDFVLNDISGLTVAGSVAAPGQIFLQDGAASGVTVAPTGSLAAGTLDSVQADAFTLLAGGTITGQQFELAPNTNGSLVTLGTVGGGGLSLAALTGIGPSAIRIGAVTSPSSGTLTTTAGSVVVGGPFGVDGLILDLRSSGGIGQSAALTAGTLSGAASGTVALGLANAIGTLDGFSAAAFTLEDAQALDVAGPVNGGSLAAITDAADLSVTGTVGAGSILLSGRNLAISGLVSDGGA
ncbi:MAG: filamentous hemagglutinin N-terminal domain-containing protein, partial [Rhodospirillales bacterium]|nr:filamentous hemagglutinin N-terminal domain-containing protein [Rhodospirillales bacterium]